MAAAVETMPTAAPSEVAAEAAAAPSFKCPPYEVLRATVLDLSKPVAQRMRCVFYLRTLGGEDAIATLCEAMTNKEGTTLFRHEIAYVLGQMRAASAVPTLSAVLADATDDPVVRHEAGEALGAVATADVLPLLEAHCSDPRPEVAETCQIAAARVRWVLERDPAAADAEGFAAENPYHSVDPAPATKAPKKKEEFVVVAARLVDTSLPLFERYRAMFTLRNNGSKAAVKALCAGLADPSPLFRHEVAYVLGQLGHEAATEALMASVENMEEHEMVRHEAAEALGAIGTPAVTEFLAKYTDDPIIMLRESALVALDVVEYWSTAAEGISTAAGGAAAAGGATGSA